MLLIKAKGGLGNRMLSAVTAIAYAEATKRDWCIDWCDGIYAPVGVNAINQLFQISKQRELADISDQDVIRPLVWTGRMDWSVRKIIDCDYPLQHSNPLIYRKLSAPITSTPTAGQTEVFWSYTSKFGRIKRYLSREQRKLGRNKVLGQILRNHLIPNVRITNTADELLGDAGDKTLGVHIRFTDLKVPIDKLIAQVAVEVEKFQYRSIYLATDSHYAEELMVSKFANVVTQKRRYSDGNGQLHSARDYNEKRQDADAALVDMIALSKCKGLLYCSRSTFAETSRLYGDFDAERLVDIDRYNWLIQIKKWVQEYL